MGLWHVYYANWQMECCGTPFSVGEEVSWPLLLTDADDMLGGDWHEELSEVVGPVEDLPGDEEGSVRVLRDDTGLTVALGGETGAGAVPGERFRQAGLLSVETHGGEWPEVSGRVRGIRVVTQEYAEVPPGSRSWEPVRGPGARQLRSVDECPKWFTDEGPGAAAKGKWLMQAGVMVTLEVPENG